MFCSFVSFFCVVCVFLFFVFVSSKVVVPHVTASYADGPKDQVDDAIPMCTLRNFPSLTEHCIEWARRVGSPVVFLLLDRDVFSGVEPPDLKGARSLPNPLSSSDELQHENYYLRLPPWRLPRAALSYHPGRTCRGLPL